MSNKIEQIMLREINKIGKLWNIPNIMCGVIINNKIEQVINWSSEITPTNPLSQAAIFRIGSNSKSFACSALIRLVSQYTIDINAPVLDYYPEFQLHNEELTKQVCLKDLVTHSIGLGKFTCSMMGFLNYQASDIVCGMKYIPSIKPFRTSFQYHNGFYLIVEKILNKLTGSSVEKFYAKNFFNKLDMTHTYTSLKFTQAKSQEVANPYVEIDGRNMMITQSSFPDCLGIGTNLNTNINDITKWLLFNLKSFHQHTTEAKLLDQQQFCNYVPFNMSNKTTCLDDYVAWQGYSLGWYKSQLEKFALYEHLGGVPGYTSYLSFIPELNAGIALLCNKSNMRYPLELIRLMFFNALTKSSSLDISYPLFEQTMDYLNLLNCKLNSYQPMQLPKSCYLTDLILYNPIYKTVNFTINSNDMLMHFEHTKLTFNCFYSGNNTFILVDHLHHFSSLLQLVILQLDLKANTLEMRIFMDNQHGGLSWVADHLFTEKY